MNPGKKISGFIEDFTGITNKMLSTAPTISEVMKELKTFIADYPLIAHNAAFDSRFLDAEFSLIKHKRKNEFACSLLASRRIYPDAPNHKLQTLVKYHHLKTDGVHHRALADAEMTAHLWMKLIADIKSATGVRNIPFEVMQRITKVPKNKLSGTLQTMREQSI
jgi:DNA polymerase-3 subunit epsilon